MNADKIVPVKPDKQDFAAVEKEHGPLPSNASEAVAFFAAPKRPGRREAARHCPAASHFICVDNITRRSPSGCGNNHLSTITATQ